MWEKSGGQRTPDRELVSNLEFLPAGPVVAHLLKLEFGYGGKIANLSYLWM